MPVPGYAGAGSGGAAGGGDGGGGAGGGSGGSGLIVNVLMSTHSRTRIWIDAATGIATSAPSTPSSVAPNSTATIVMNGCTCTVRFWIWGWITWFSNCWYTIAQIAHTMVAVGKFSNSVTTPISTAAIMPAISAIVSAPAT